MKRQEFLERLKYTLDLFDNNRCGSEDHPFKGHPKFYFLHEKEELEKEFERFVPFKESYDKYDFFYVSNHLIKFFLNGYDSHTMIKIRNAIFLPLVIKVIDGHAFVIDGNTYVKEHKGMEIKYINSVDINTIINELSECYSYANNSYFYVQLGYALGNASILRSLPSLNNIDKKIVFSNENDSIVFDLDKAMDDLFKTKDTNFNLEYRDDIAIITYNACKDIDKMEKLISEVSNRPDINHFVVDLRGNGGGDSRVNNPLINFLEDKDTYVISDAEVFSSGRMCLNHLIGNGAISFGESPGTPTNCFGNVQNRFYLDDVGVFGRGSVSFWYFDDNNSFKGYTKDNFENEVMNNPKILEIKYTDIDIPLRNTIDDYIYNTDTLLDTTIQYIKNKNKIR